MRINVSPATTGKAQVSAVSPVPSAIARSSRALLMSGMVSIKIGLLHQIIWCPLKLHEMRAFRTGPVGTLGVGAGILIWGTVSSLSTVLSYIGIPCS